MADVENPVPANRLLAAIPTEERRAISPLLTHVPLEFHQDLYAAGQTTDHVWFPSSGVVSLVAVIREGHDVEIATVGPEGMVGIQRLLGSDQVAHRAFVQVPGSALRMGSNDFEAALAAHPVLRRTLMRYALALLGYVAQSSACNRMHSVEQRLARWMLQTQDRVHAPTFPLTQEFIGQMLGVRRPTVSLAAGMLMKSGLIHYVRGQMTILDRARLKEAACECYGVIRDEFDRLVGATG